MRSRILRESFSQRALKTFHSKMIAKIVLSLALLGSVLSFPTPENIPIYGPPENPRYGPSVNLHKDPYTKPYEEEKKPYAFDYGVRDDYTGANFGHKENSDGDTIQGSYNVELPDGRIQTVNYIADHHNGFQAEVTYEGEATYPHYKPEESKYGPHAQFKPQPKYKPQPQYKSQPQYKPQPQYNQQPQYSNPQPSYELSPRYEEDTPVFAEEGAISEYN